MWKWQVTTRQLKKKTQTPTFVVKLTFLVAVWVRMQPLNKESKPITMQAPIKGDVQAIRTSALFR